LPSWQAGELTVSVRAGFQKRSIERDLAATPWSPYVVTLQFQQFLDVMKRCAILLSTLALVLMHGAAARADTLASVITPTGVDVQAHLATNDKLVITILPTMDVKLNGQLGIGMKALDDYGTWQDDLPSLLVVDGDYFDGAVLQTLVFDGDGIDMSTALGITFGACLPADGVCILEEAEVTLMREDDGSLGLTLATLKP
jgi:hypothetical protein